MINILIAEDNLFAQKALEEKLSNFDDIVIQHVVGNGQEAVAAITDECAVDLILMDIEMPILNGINATELIKQKFPKIKVVMITIYDDDNHIFDAIKAGADSYILKESKAEKIYETIIDTLAGGAIMSPSIALKALQLLKNSSVSLADIGAEYIELSVRETEVLEELCKGSTNKAIGSILFISPFTVKRHIENIYQKLQAHNRIELIHKARENKLI